MYVRFSCCIREIPFPEEHISLFPVHLLTATEPWMLWWSSFCAWTAKHRSTHLPVAFGHTKYKHYASIPKLACKNWKPLIRSIWSCMCCNDYYNYETISSNSVYTFTPPLVGMWLLLFQKFIWDAIDQHLTTAFHTSFSWLILCLQKIEKEEIKKGEERAGGWRYKG